MKASLNEQIPVMHCSEKLLAIKVVGYDLYVEKLSVI